MARLDEHLQRLRLNTARERVEALLQEASEQELSLVRPQAPNDVWSADFVFDRTADGRVVKCLTIVDDATTEAVAIVPARALGGRPVTRHSTALRLSVASRGCCARIMPRSSAAEPC